MYLQGFTVSRIKCYRTKQKLITLSVMPSYGLGTSNYDMKWDRFSRHVTMDYFTTILVMKLYISNWRLCMMQYCVIESNDLFISFFLTTNFEAFKFPGTLFFKHKSNQNKENDYTSVFVRGIHIFSEFGICFAIVFLFYVYDQVRSLYSARNPLSIFHS